MCWWHDTRVPRSGIEVAGAQEVEEWVTHKIIFIVTVSRPHSLSSPRLSSPSTCWWFRWRSGGGQGLLRRVPCANLGEWALGSDPRFGLPYFTGELVSILRPSPCCRPMLVTPPSQCLQCPDQISGRHWHSHTDTQRERERGRERPAEPFSTDWWCLNVDVPNSVHDFKWMLIYEWCMAGREFKNGHPKHTCINFVKSCLDTTWAQ